MSELKTYRPELAVYVVWHSEFAAGAELATHVYDQLTRNSQEPLSRGLGIPVYLRVAESPQSVPPPTRSSCTDVSSTREWCQREVLVAKRHGRPVVVLHKVEKAETRSFPYLVGPAVAARRSADRVVAERVGSQGAIPGRTPEARLLAGPLRGCRVRVGSLPIGQHAAK